jgi:AraC-like DNA-binding protein
MVHDPASVAVRSTPVPGAYAAHLVEVVERLGASADELLDGSGLSVERLQDPDTRITLEDYKALVRRAYRVTGEEGLGFYLGLEMRVSMHGFVGFAAMTARDVRGAIDVAVRFAATRSSVIALALHEHEDTAELQLLELLPLDDARELVVASLMVGLANIGEAITGAPLRGRAHVAFAEPRAFGRFRHLLPGEVRFDQPDNRLVFPRADLDRPLVMADPIAAELARQQCARELEALKQARGVRHRVEALLAAPGGGYRSVEQVAEQLHVSPRTLKRQLAAEGTTYSDVLDAVRHARALTLLPRSELGVDAIAAELGYADTANFTRAFKRWTGQTPGAFRRGAR